MLGEIRNATETQLNKPVKINSISYPQHLRFSWYLNTIAYTTLEVYPEIKDFIQIGPYLNCIRMAYDLDNSEALGYEPGTDIDFVNPLLVHFDCQREFLDVSIMSVGLYSDITERKFRIDGFGSGRYAPTVSFPDINQYVVSRKS